MTVKRRVKIRRKSDIPVGSEGAAMAMMMAIAEGLSGLEDIFDFRSRSPAPKKNNDIWSWQSEICEVKMDSLRTTAWRLKKKGLVEKSGEEYHLSILGMEVVKMVRKNSEEKQWDGKWRMAMFDIPETKRNERDWIRKELLAMDYRPIQQSVFLGQYPPEKDFMEELSERKLKNFVRFLTIGEVDKGELDKIFNW